MTELLYPYQETLKNNISKSAKDYKSILVQLETGGGKTRIFSAIADSFLKISQKDVIIFVDSDSIFNQTRKTLFNVFNIESDTINKASAQIKRNTLFGQPRVFVAMVETFDRRSERDTFLHQIRDVGLVIVDECHMGNFIKIFEHFPFALRLGFTATPISSNKRHPLKNYYETIVCGPTTSELIAFNAKHPNKGIVRDVSCRWEGNLDKKVIDQLELASGWKGEDHNQDIVGNALKGNRQIQNTIDAYVKFAAGKKILCFNANVAHSKEVTREMCNYGLNARHIDGTASDSYRKEILGDPNLPYPNGWLAQTQNAILCNVGMTTKGFDEPSVEGVILNTMTKSITKYRQMCGRSARPYLYPNGEHKRYHIIIDMCDNIIGEGHGQWSDDKDWEYIFKNPKMPQPGVAPKKECPECHSMCSATQRICRGITQDFYTGDEAECGYEFPIKVHEEVSIEGHIVFVSKNVDVSAIINFPKFQGKKDYFTFHETVRACAYFWRQSTKHDFIEKDEFERIWSITYEKIIEWQRIKGRQSESGRKIRDGEWFTRTGREDLLRFLRDYGFTVNLVEEGFEIDPQLQLSPIGTKFEL